MDDCGESDEARANRQAQQKREWEEVNTEHAKAQRVLDFYWQSRLDAEAALRDEIDGWVDVRGFRERRRSSCHKSKRDPDYWL
jgi:hypothetical protein